MILIWTLLQQQRLIFPEELIPQREKKYLDILQKISSGKVTLHDDRFLSETRYTG